MLTKYKSDAFAAIHESASALFEVGAIDKQTMREFDVSCLREAGTEAVPAPCSTRPAGQGELAEPEARADAPRSDTFRIP